MRNLPKFTNAEYLANGFNSFFITKVINLRNSIPIVTNNPFSNSSKLFTGTRFTEFEQVTEDDILEIFKTNSIKTSPLDPIPASLLKQISSELVPYNTKIVNCSLREGSLEGLKNSIVDPLLKNEKLDSESMKNYRPVANLAFISKLTERVVLKQLTTHMEVNALQNDTQFAYKKMHSTETMLLGMVNEILMNFESNRCIVKLFLDLSAAFDTVDINKMLDILHTEMGIDGTVLKWINSFLSGRTQQVKIENAFSGILEVLYGVPQGSVLGPFLFSLYVRSQSSVFNKCSFGSSSFADDTNGRKSFAISFQFEVLSNCIVNCLQEIKSWMHTHFLKINTDKSTPPFHIATSY